MIVVGTAGMDNSYLIPSRSEPGSVLPIRRVPCDPPSKRYDGWHSKPHSFSQSTVVTFRVTVSIFACTYSDIVTPVTVSEYVQTKTVGLGKVNRSPSGSNCNPSKRGGTYAFHNNVRRAASLEFPTRQRCFVTNLSVGLISRPGCRRSKTAAFI